METSFKNVFSISHRSGNPKFTKFSTLPDIENVERVYLRFIYLFICLRMGKSGVSKTIRISERFQRISWRRHLDKYWKYGDHKNLKT